MFPFFNIIFNNDNICNIGYILITHMLQVLVGHKDYEVTGGSIVFKGENLLDMEPEDRSIAGLFMSFQSPVEIPGVSNIDFLLMAYNARRRKLGLPEYSPIEVLVFELWISTHDVS